MCETKIRTYENDRDALLEKLEKLSSKELDLFPESSICAAAAREIRSLEKALKEAEDLQIFGFYEDEYPVYFTRKEQKPNELCEIVDPLEINQMVWCINEMVAALEPFAEFVRGMNVPYDTPLTAGSELARAQVPASAFKRALEIVDGRR